MKKARHAVIYFIDSVRWFVIFHINCIYQFEYSFAQPFFLAKYNSGAFLSLLFSRWRGFSALLFPIGQLIVLYSYCWIEMMEIAKLYDAEIHEFYFKHSFFVDYRRSVFFCLLQEIQNFLTLLLVAVKWLYSAFPDHYNFYLTQTMKSNLLFLCFTLSTANEQTEKTQFVRYNNITSELMSSRVWPAKDIVSLLPIDKNTRFIKLSWWWSWRQERKKTRKEAETICECR